MRIKIFVYRLLIVGLISSCRPVEEKRALLNRITALKTEILELESNLLDLELECLDNGAPPGNVMHIEFLNLKPTVTEKEKEKLISRLLSLSELNLIKALKLGYPDQMGSNHLKKSPELVLQFSMDVLDDLDSLQTDSIYQLTRAEIEEYLATPIESFNYYLSLEKLQ